jgi:hypothetical protein
MKISVVRFKQRCCSQFVMWPSVLNCLSVCGVLFITVAGAKIK